MLLLEEYCRIGKKEGWMEEQALFLSSFYFVEASLCILYIFVLSEPYMVNREIGDREISSFGLGYRKMIIAF